MQKKQISAALTIILLSMHIAIRTAVSSPLLNTKGEVCDINDVSQFWPDKTQFACGFYGAGMIRFAGRPANGPAGTALDIKAWAEKEYIVKFGSADASMTSGVTLADEHTLIVKALQSNPDNIHYQDLNATSSTNQMNDIDNIRSALQSGYPVVVSIAEVSVYDMELKGSPYTWATAGLLHVFVITGMTTDGNYLVHDQANVVGNLKGTNTPRPSPRIYDASKLNVQWAIMARMPWLVAFPTNWSPTTGIPVNQAPSVAAFQRNSASAVFSKTLNLTAQGMEIRRLDGRNSRGHLLETGKYFFHLNTTIGKSSKIVCVSK